MPPRPRHLAATHRYFWPENYPYADMLRQIVEALRPHVDRVTTLSSAPPRREDRHARLSWAAAHDVDLEAVHLGTVRTASRLVKVTSHLAYAAWLLTRLLRIRPDLTWVASTPPVLAGAVVRLATRITGGRFVYHVQDIHPEALMSDDHGPAMQWLLHRAQQVDRATVEAAEVSVVLSEDMRSTLLDRGLDPTTTDIRVVNNFVQVPDAPEPLTPITSEQPFELLFAGGIGPFQQLHRVLDVARRIDPEEQITFTIMGDGPSRRHLEATYGDLPHVSFLGQRPRHEAHAAMCRASCGVVSLKPSITRVAYPSKVIDYRAFGLPILAMVDTSSALAQELRDDGFSLVPDSDDPERVAEALRGFRRRLVADPPDRDELADRARREVAAEAVVPKLVELVHAPSLA